MAKPAVSSESFAVETPEEVSPDAVSYQDDRGWERLTIDDPASAIFSPARQLQQTLGREFAGVEQIEPWPVRRTIALVTCTCGAFWTAVYFAIAALTG
ncbi:MAG: hypothetical protein AAF986_06415 [Pseudomonadota bacterium]